MHPDKVDQTFPDERNVLGLVDEQLPYGHRSCGPPAQEMKILGVLGGERVVEEEQVVRFELPGEAYRMDRRNALVDVVQQLDLVAKSLAQVFEETRDQATVRGRLPVPASAVLLRSWTHTSSSPARRSGTARSDNFLPLYLLTWFSTSLKSLPVAWA